MIGFSRNRLPLNRGTRNRWYNSGWASWNAFASKRSDDFGVFQVTSTVPSGSTSVSASPNAWVTRIVHENGHATGVKYIDAAGRENFQPADIVCMTAFHFNNIRLLLLSGLGTPYDPQTETGSVGRNFAYQLGTG